MPAVSQAQRGFLAHKFGPKWMRKHHFANKGKLPEYKHKTKMNDPSKLVRLAQIDKQLDSIVRFAYSDEDDKTPPWSTPAKVGAGAGIGVGGFLAHQAVQRGGGYGALIPQARVGYALGKTAGSSIPYGQALKTAAGAATQAPGAAVGGLAGVTGSKISSLLAKLAKPAAKALEAKTRMISFDENILQPTNVPKTKIVQEQFPAGKSPGYQRDPTAEILRLPFPELMKLLKQKNILQQQFSKHGKLVELGSRLDGITKQ